MASLFQVPHLPISCTISMASLFQAPDVSTAIGTNVCVVMDMYLVVLKVAAWFAEAPASTAASLRWHSANVSATVTSQIIGFPRDHGMSVAPSGRFPSVRDSRQRLMALHITSLSWACRCCPLRCFVCMTIREDLWRPRLCRMDKCVARTFGVEAGITRQRGSSHRSVSGLLMLLAEPEAIRPHAGMMLQECVTCPSRWSVWCIYLQAGDPRLGDPTPYVYVVIRLVVPWYMIGWSNRSWHDLYRHLECWRMFWMELWSSCVDATEAKKAKDASVTALLIPSFLHSPIGWLVTTGRRQGQHLIFLWVIIIIIRELLFNERSTIRM